ncbi:MAG TPA: alpha-1,4-glucan--maltose-1-phosphate maltosyltransferase [bacterium]|nr:alpha-1,4-glucan--maltose-1-phosphate maltosyltransferase [bacterium]
MEAKPRVAIEALTPQVDCGRFPAKRIAGDTVVVECDAFADGHDVLAGVLRYRREGDRRWSEAPLALVDNDRWRGTFAASHAGRYRYTVEVWVDHFATWTRDLAKRVDARQDVRVDLEIGAALVRAAARRAGGQAEAKPLAAWADRLGAGDADAVRIALSDDLAAAVRRHPDRTAAARYAPELRLVVDRERARCGAWYEMFPRSTSPEPGRHGTFADCEARLPYVAGMGFDVLYLPPIHPVGRDHRKGRNNAEIAAPGDPGSPWAIGAAEGGHTAIHPQLGTLDAFRRLVTRAREHGLEVALDLAYQCAPDHPYAREHPEWFRRRPDGTIQYAENPPKKYQDIYPFDFESAGWQSLWKELLGVVRFWMGEGVRIFRVDNPHTKPFPFWEWLIEDIHRTDPDVIFLAEAFTRPKVMYRLAKLGFTQSYTYFTWRTAKAELVQYFSELTRSPVRDFFRPHLWPNTPDILHKYLQDGGRPAFAVRLVLAATLGANYGIYGPAFELCEHQSAAPNSPPPASEEYLNAEKYEIKHWALDRPDSLRGLIGRVNTIRRAHPALQRDDSLVFHGVDNDQLLCYSKTAAYGGGDAVLVVVNLDPHSAQSGWTALALDALGLGADEPFAVTDLLTDARYAWRGARNYVSLRPSEQPAHIFRVERGAT